MFFSIIIDFFSIIIDFFSIFFFNIIETNIELFSIILLIFFSITKPFQSGLKRARDWKISIPGPSGYHIVGWVDHPTFHCATLQCIRQVESLPCYHVDDSSDGLYSMAKPCCPIQNGSNNGTKRHPWFPAFVPLKPTIFWGVLGNPFPKIWNTATKTFFRIGSIHICKGRQVLGNWDC